MPLVVSAVRILLGIGTQASGVLVSSARFLAFALVGERLRRLARQEANPGWWIAFLLCWPFGFYFHTLYTESLFAVLATLALLWLAQSRVWPAAIATAALTATRRQASCWLHGLACGSC